MGIFKHLGPTVTNPHMFIMEVKSKFVVTTEFRIFIFACPD
jgi:hypothetical protein